MMAVSMENYNITSDTGQDKTDNGNKYGELK